MSNAGAERAAELLKTLHGQSLSAREIMRHTGWSEKVVYAWCKEWAAQGILMRNQADLRGPGYCSRVMLYRLADRWGGK
jgi:transposase